MKKSILFRIACDPIARVWSGVNSVIIPADIVEAEPALYQGAGNLVNIPDLEQVLNGTAARIDITVSGVSAESLRLARDDAATVKGAQCHVGNAYFDDDWQLVEVEWLGVLRADFLTTAHQNTTRSITLSLGTDDTDRSHAPLAFWTDRDQRARSPTDAFFDHVAGINQGASRRFGTHDK